MIVVDASVVVVALADDERDGIAARDRLADERLVAPHLVDVEVASAWRRLVASAMLDERRANLAFSDLAALRVERVAHAPLLPRAWELRETLTTYDAVYVALAELLDTTLVTADSRLARANGPRCPIDLLR